MVDQHSTMSPTEHCSTNALTRHSIYTRQRRSATGQTSRSHRSQRHPSQIFVGTFEISLFSSTLSSLSTVLDVQCNFLFAVHLCVTDCSRPFNISSASSNESPSHTLHLSLSSSTDFFLRSSSFCPLKVRAPVIKTFYLLQFLTTNTSYGFPTISTIPLASLPSVSQTSSSKLFITLK